MSLPVAILAGGLATRLRPLTEKIPKALVEVANRPFIAWQLEYLCAQGVKEVVVCAGYLGEQIVDAVGDGAQFGLRVRYSFDGDRLLGTAGAIRKALPLLGEAFFVFYGDSFLPINFGQVEEHFRTSGLRGLMTVLRNQNKWDRSNVEFEAGIVVEYNKIAPSPRMAFIDYGLSVLSASAVRDQSPATPADLADVFHAMSCRGELAGLEMQQRFYEIGSFAGLKETEEFLLGHANELR